MVECRVKEEHNIELKRPFTREEVKTATFDMHPDKAPGPDGLNLGFYHSFWIACKTMANQMRKFMNVAIREVQSAFIPGRFISDNAMISFETMHYLKRKTQGKKGYVALKTDMSMAYQFSQGSTIFGQFIPSRGLRQGDPLSPYLFLVVAEGLSTMLRTYDRRGLLHGIKAEIGEANIIKHCLDSYQKASGQQVNLQKSDLYFSRNTSEDMKITVKHALGVKEIATLGKYLGLPSIVVVQAIPDYVMMLFLLPTSTCDSIEKAMNGFWWRGKGGDTGGMRWMAWKGLCKRKEDGELGFREVQNFNLAMLAKSAWSLLTRPEALVSRIYKARYFPTGDLLSATVGNNPSYVWRSLCAGLQVLQGGCVRRIGDGRTTKIFHTLWLPSEQLQVIQSVCNHGMEEMVVSELICEETRTWSEGKLETIFNAQEIELIQKITLSSTSQPAKWMWLFDPKGMYTVRGGYMRLYDQVGHEIE
ncbi:PREDICTED: uncharacterized protein LOC109221769, partial [Nicotiana attenuata]|uniref:uncharacterized protein LOC109221769 n=1 Tax=Nicotiana attenuata TaxID=49451 RepID=UPI000905D2FD